MGNSIFDAAANNDVKAIQTFLDAGASVNAVDGASYRYTPLIKACGFAMYPHNKPGAVLETVKLLVEHKADLDMRCYLGKTALWHATDNGYTPEALHLIASGANLSIVSGTVSCVFMFCVAK